MHSKKALYDSIGDGYDSTRQPDPYLVSRLMYHLQPQPGKRYADFGCGTGNYTIALHRQGVDLAGIDISAHMLEQAQTKAPEMKWIQADINDLPFKDGHYHGGVATLTVHHWTDLSRGFREVARVIKGGHLVLFTSLPAQMRGYWLHHYFPQMMQRSMEQMPSMEMLSAAFDLAELQIVAKEKYFVEPDLQDWFLYSGKFDANVYLNKQRRDGISSFRKLCPPDELQSGLDQLQQDIDSGAITSIRQRYANDEGDYLFIKLQA